MEGQYMAFIYIIREPITYISYNILLERRPKSFTHTHTHFAVVKTNINLLIDKSMKID